MKKKKLGMKCWLLSLCIASAWVLQGCGGSGGDGEAFEADDYFERPGALAGLQFDASLRVESDLGWREGVGRIMTFSIIDDGRQISAILPGELADEHFRKGERYRVTLAVRAGGLIEIRSARRE